MNSSGAFLAGLFATVLGVAFWVSAQEFLAFEMPWGGVLVAVFVAVGLFAFREGREKSDLAFLGGFFALVGTAGGTVLDGYMDSRYDDEFIVGNLAENVLTSYEAEGHTLEWRKQSDASKQHTQAGYPKELWQKAEAMWQQASPEQRMEFRSEIEEAHDLAFMDVAQASLMDQDALMFLGAGVLLAALLGFAMGGHMHESVIMMAYSDAAENDHAETHPYLAPGAEYGMNEDEQRKAEEGVEVSNSNRRGWDEKPEEASPAPEASASKPVEDEASTSFAGFAAADVPEDDGKPGFGASEPEDGDQKKAG
ncbi:MAG: hypothetical protein ACYTGR_00615 [Planctomycetota bacterium]|jgi:hypothetical protein